MCQFDPQHNQLEWSFKIRNSAAFIKLCTVLKCINSGFSDMLLLIKYHKIYLQGVYHGPHSISDLQVDPLVVQGSPAAEAGVGQQGAGLLRLIVRPAQLPPLHRVRG